MERSLADGPALKESAAISDRDTDRPDATTSIGAAIDIGSNSVHLLVAVLGPGFLQPLRDTSELLGLGDVVDADHEIPASSRRAVVNVLESFAATCLRSGAERIALLGTEPLRRARNSAVLANEIREATGLDLRVLTEREEAVLTFIGVTRGELPSEPLIVVDIGGGSTEVASYTPGRPLQVTSIALGSSRLTNAIVEHDPPSEPELQTLFDAAATAVHEADMDAASLAPGARAVFVGGTATNVARLGRLTRKALADDRRKLGKLTYAQVSMKFSVKPRRARQLAAGVAIVDALIERFGLDTADASDASLRDGAIIAAATYGDAWTDLMEELVGGLVPA